MKSLKKLLSRRKMPVTGGTGSAGRLDSTAAAVSAPDFASHHEGELPLRDGASLQYAEACHQATQPLQDAHILQTEASGSHPHLFAALLTSSSTAQGGNYLRRNMYREIMKQVRLLGDVSKAIRASILALDRSWRDMHPFNHNVLDGVRLAAAYVDLASNTLYVASTGGCRVVVGSRTADGSLAVTADVGRPGITTGGAATGSNGLAGGIACVPLDEQVDTIILGSTGLWRQLSSQAAMLRMQHYWDACPTASGHNAAAHLANYALHQVIWPLRSSRDPRMAALREVSHLQSLWVGDVTNYKWGGKQPVRRRRGDVHGDLSAVVLRANWAGTQNTLSPMRLGRLAPMREGAMPKCASTNTMRTPVTKAQLSWALVRMHFLTHRRAQAAAVRAQWLEAAQLARQHAAPALQSRHQQQEQQQSSTAPQSKQPGASPLNRGSMQLQADARGMQPVTVA